MGTRRSAVPRRTAPPHRAVVLHRTAARPLRRPVSVDGVRDRFGRRPADPG